MFDWRHKLLAIGLVLALLAGGYLYIQEQLNRVRAETVASQQQTIVDALKVREEQRNDQLAQTLAMLAKQKAEVKTPVQAAKSIEKEIDKAVPQPIQITVPPSPNEPAIVNVPQVDLKPIADMISDCAAAKVQVPTLTQDLTDTRAQLQAVEKERDAFRQALRGGTWIQRIGKVAKYLTIGAGIGALAVCATNHCR